jgi:hypothetical protein
MRCLKEWAFNVNVHRIRRFEYKRLRNCSSNSNRLLVINLGLFKEWRVSWVQFWSLIISLIFLLCFVMMLKVLIVMTFCSVIKLLSKRWVFWEILKELLKRNKSFILWRMDQKLGLIILVFQLRIWLDKLS